MTIDPADVLKNPGDYLLDGEPIDHIFLYIANASVGAWSQDLDFQKRVTRRPRTRTVKARAWRLINGRTISVVTADDIDLETFISTGDGCEWAGPEFDVTVEVP